MNCETSPWRSDDIPPVTALLKREMEAVEGLSVPLLVEVGHGRSWAEAH